MAGSQSSGVFFRAQTPRAEPAERFAPEVSGQNTLIVTLSQTCGDPPATATCRYFWTQSTSVSHFPLACHLVSLTLPSRCGPDRAPDESIGSGSLRRLAHHRLNQRCCVGLGKNSYCDWRPGGLPGILSRFSQSAASSHSPSPSRMGAVLITLLIDAKTRRNLIRKIGSECVLRGHGQFISGGCRWCIDHHGGTGVTAQAEETRTEY